MSSMLAFDHHELDFALLKFGLDFASSANQTQMMTTMSDSNKEGPDDATHIVWVLWCVFYLMNLFTIY